MRTHLARLASMFRRRRLDRDLDDEVAFHLEMLTADHRRRGLSDWEARAAAIRHFGGITQMKESYREQRGLPAIETFVQDARYAVRTLVRTPGFTCAALIALTLGIGANTAIFSVVNAVLLRPLPYPGPDRLVQLMRRYPGNEWSGHTGRRYMHFRDHLTSVEAIAAWRNPTGINLVNVSDAEFVQQMSVSKEFFQVFGIMPAIGTGFRAEHDLVGGPDVAILSHGLWQRRFGADPSVVGRGIQLGSATLTVIGVMPDTFTAVPPADIFVPLRPSTRGPGSGFNYNVTARLRPDTSLGQASAEAAGVWAGLASEFPGETSDRELPSGFTPLQDVWSNPVRRALLMMLGAVGLLLLIACANTANLLLARASGRGREVAVRAALGASRARIVRQLLTESVLLAVTGAALGLLLASWGVRALLALTPPGFTVHQEVRLDTTVLLVTLVVALTTGLVFGLAPALSLARSDLTEAFKDDASRTTAGRRTGWLRRTLVVGEIAICMVLLVGAALLIQTFLRMRAIDPGFDPSGVLTARMSLQGSRYESTADVTRFFDQGLERIRRIPGVRSAAIVNGVPIEYGLNMNVDILDGPEAERVENALTDWRYASVDYFKTMGIPIVSGRGFTESDRAGAPPVAVVNEEFSRRFFTGSPTLGRRIRIFDSDGAIEIVGVAQNVREQGLIGDLPAMMFVPVAQANPAGIAASHTYFPMSWVVRADQTNPQLVRQIREEIRSLDPKQPFSAFKTMNEVKAEELTTERFQMTLLATFAGIGLLLAAAGIYGVLAYFVAQRTREIGIRLALGATRDRILRSVVGHGLSLGIAGAVLGTVGALATTWMLQGFVWGVSTLDPVTLLGVAGMLVGVSVLASLIPALRAIRLNPVSALRQ